jgi:hypothetical protein
MSVISALRKKEGVHDFIHGFVSLYSSCKRKRLHQQQTYQRPAMPSQFRVYRQNRQAMIEPIPAILASDWGSAMQMLNAQKIGLTQSHGVHGEENTMPQAGPLLITLPFRIHPSFKGGIRKGSKGGIRKSHYFPVSLTLKRFSPWTRL